MEPQLGRVETTGIELAKNIPEGGIGIHGTTLERAQRIHHQGFVIPHGLPLYYYHFNPDMQKIADFQFRSLQLDLSSALIHAARHRQLNEPLAFVLFEPLHPLVLDSHIEQVRQGDSILRTEHDFVGPEKVLGIVSHEGEIPNPYIPKGEAYYKDTIPKITDVLKRTKH